MAQSAFDIESRRISSWQLRSRSITFSAIPKWMGILNVTPDSFSDGGKFADTRSAIDRALQLEDDGADILDIGGESTRPYSDPVATDEELHRIVPVLEALQGRIGIPISIDTTKPKVAEAALALGAEIINDVSGMTNPAMVEVALRAAAGICVMHMQGTPQTMQDRPTYTDVVRDIYGFLDAQVSCLINRGIAREKICIDPGIGFGKTHQHNLELVQKIAAFHQLGLPVLVGHSRKGFINKSIGQVLNNANADDTLFGTIGVSLAMARARVQILRIHDVRAMKAAFALFEAAGGLS